MSIARWIAFLALVPVTLGAQTTAARRVVVVQIAGSNLYLNAGNDSGVVTGDTLSVSRQGSELNGSFLVITATATRSVVSFAGPAFAVTRGDTLLLTHGFHPAAASTAATGAIQPNMPLRVQPLGTRSSGTLSLDFTGSRTTNIGLGADPVRNTQDFTSPGARLRWGLEGPQGTSLNLNISAYHRTGPAGVFQTETPVRIYEMSIDQRLGRGSARISVGRFLSSFDHASGYWDGAMVRVGRDRGLSAGVAAGFEPQRVNELFSTEAPKYAGFVGLRTGNGVARYRADLAYHEMLPHGVTLRARVIDWSQRLDVGQVHLAQDLETGPDPLTGKWGINRFQARLSLPAGPGTELYGAAISDHPPPVDTTFGLSLSRRERIAAGLSHRSGRFYASLDGSVNSPRTALSRGYAGSATVGLVNLVGRVSVSATGNYFKIGPTQGVLGGPTLELAFGGMRVRTGYQFMLNKSSLYSVITHNADLTISRPITSRLDWLIRVNGRYGANVRGGMVYTGLDLRF